MAYNEGKYRRLMEDRGSWEVTVFAPVPLSHQQFFLSGRTSAEAFRAEMALVRLEDHLASSLFGRSLMQTIARIEAYSTVRVDGLQPSMRDLAVYDATAKSQPPNAAVPSHATAQPDASASMQAEASQEAYRYLQTLRWISHTVEPGFTFTPDFILDVHSRCVHGKPAVETGTHFRGNPCLEGTPERAPEDECESDAGSGPACFQPSLPEEITPLVNDLCDFVNSGCFSPIAQASFMHFQFEEIRPFKTGLDRTGRALSHALFYARGLVKSIIAPIALLPAINTPCHAKLLLPYRFGNSMDDRDRALALDNWARFCADSTGAAAAVTESCIAHFEKLKAEWSRKLGKSSKGSAADAILQLLAGYPLITVECACKLTGKSFSACNDALNRMHRCGIVQTCDDARSPSRIFEASGAFALIDGATTSLLSAHPVSRELFAGNQPRN
ncbi:Fic family protein [Adlercreutzia sp. ZJ141]|uniref:Fic family protein n=1 Tax=Adlercreutzia sp. ZJ141 TaxID=2709406 RepID=UPI0013ED3A15|nr:Fic family protein [Adlercreutzia sp. ZJ141]